MLFRNRTFAAAFLILFGYVLSARAADDANVQMTTTNGSTQFGFQDSTGKDVVTVNSVGVVNISSNTILSGTTFYQGGNAVIGGATSKITVPTLSASLPVQTDASENLISAAVDLSGAQVTGNMGVSHLNSGTSASNQTFWRGDATWSGAMEYLGSSIISAAGGAATTGAVTVAARDELVILVRIAGYAGGGDIASLRFNADATAANYHASHINFSNATTPVLSRNNFTTGGNIQLGPAAINAGRVVLVTCTNAAASRKVCKIEEQQEATAQGTIAQMDLAYGEWFNTSNQITSVELRTNGGANMNQNSGFVVFGRNF